MAITAPLITSHYDPNFGDLRQSLQGPDSEHIFGTDNFGRDIFTRVLFGARISAVIAMVAVLIGIFIGVPLGLVSGFYGGYMDNFIMRAIDIMLSFPRMLLAMLLTTILGIGLQTLIIALGVVSIPNFARQVRGAVLTEVEEEYVQASISIGNSDFRTMFVHILPNVTAPIIIQASFNMATCILMAGGLSFLGIGVTPPTPEWGAMLAGGRKYLRIAPYLVLYPGLILAMVVLGLNLLGDTLREIFDPRMK